MCRDLVKASQNDLSGVANAGATHDLELAGQAAVRIKAEQREVAGTWPIGQASGEIAFGRRSDALGKRVSPDRCAPLTSFSVDDRCANSAC